MKSEHEIFSSFTDAIALAQSHAIDLAHARPDQPWQQVAAKLEELKQGLYAMVSAQGNDGFVGKFKQ